MAMHLDDYVPIVGPSVVEETKWISRRLASRRVLNVNSTAVGGGVAEILHRMVPLLQELGIEVRWEVIQGEEKFFAVTKKIHNGLHGTAVDLTPEDHDIYWRTQEINLQSLNLDADILFIHDAQPVGLINRKKEMGRRWIWRCHVDVSAPHPPVWRFLRPLVNQYDACVFSSPRFSQRTDVRQALILPSIDPLSDKNKELTSEFIDSVLEGFGIHNDRPIIAQVSRFDRLKDPIGVIEAYQLVKPYIDCQLLLAGGSATDDPEGATVLDEVRDRAAHDPDIHVLELPPTSHLEINAIQRGSTVILQKSIREGFGLTVTEALWKGKAVIAGAVGGIPLQIAHKYSGILTHSIEGTAYWLKQLLQAPEYARRLGENGREQVRDNFLLTRHLKDYLLLFLSLEYNKDDIIYL